MNVKLVALASGLLVLAAVSWYVVPRFTAPASLTEEQILQRIAEETPVNSPPEVLAKLARVRVHAPAIDT